MEENLELALKQLLDQADQQMPEISFLEDFSEFNDVVPSLPPSLRNHGSSFSPESRHIDNLVDRTMALVFGLTAEAQNSDCADRRKSLLGKAHWLVSALNTLASQDPFFNIHQEALDFLNQQYRHQIRCLGEEKRLLVLEKISRDVLFHQTFVEAAFPEHGDFLQAWRQYHQSRQRRVDALRAKGDNVTVMWPTSEGEFSIRSRNQQDKMSGNLAFFKGYC